MRACVRVERHGIRRWRQHGGAFDGLTGSMLAATGQQRRHGPWSSMVEHRAPTRNSRRPQLAPDATRGVCDSRRRDRRDQLKAPQKVAMRLSLRTLSRRAAKSPLTRQNTPRPTGPSREHRASPSAVAYGHRWRIGELRRPTSADKIPRGRSVLPPTPETYGYLDGSVRDRASPQRQAARSTESAGKSCSTICSVALSRRANPITARPWIAACLHP